MTCLQCNKEISPKAKYCTDKCRMAYNRANTQPEQDSTTQPEQVPRTGQPEHSCGDGRCMGCQREFSPDFPACVCHECFKDKGIRHTT